MSMLISNFLFIVLVLMVVGGELFDKIIETTGIHQFLSPQ